MSAPPSDSKPTSESLASSVKAASDAVDSGISELAHGISSSVASASRTASSAYADVVVVLDQAKGYVDTGIATARTLEDSAIAGIKSAVAYTANNPMIAYPTLTTAGLLALPFARRLLWRYTFGRLVSPDNVLKTSEGKVEALRSRLTDYQAQAQKLEERMVAGEEELTRAYQKLKGTRLELQRLAGSVSSSQATAKRVLVDLRGIKQTDASVPVRGEVANQEAELRALLSKVKRNVTRIANHDI